MALCVMGQIPKLRHDPGVHLGLAEFHRKCRVRGVKHEQADACSSIGSQKLQSSHQMKAAADGEGL